MSPRGQRRPGEHIPRPRRKVHKTSGSKSSWCPLLLPAAAAQTTVALAQMVAVQWQIRGAR